MPIIAILDTGYKTYTYEKQLFKTHGYDLQLYKGDPLDTSAKQKLARQAVGILIRGTEVDGEFFDSCPQLKAVVRYGVGYDNVNLDHATERGIRVANVQGYGNHSVSGHALALMLACVRGLHLGVRQIHSHFSSPPFEDIFELHDKTLGIIGLGRIGSQVARKAGGLFRHVFAVDPYKSDDFFDMANARRVNLEVLLAESHVISLHCNLTQETRYLINDKAFALMKQRPVLINTARGPIVDEHALIEALNANRIHSAGLDVFEHEPPGPAQQLLLNHPRVFATGHYAWYSETASLTLQRRAADNLIALLRGETIEDCLNPAV